MPPCKAGHTRPRDRYKARTMAPPSRAEHDVRSSGHERDTRIHAARGLDVEQGEWRPLRQHQPADRGPDARQGAARRQAPAAALLAGHAERREGHGHAGGAAGARARRRRIRRLADQDQRRRPVRQRLRRREPELEDPGAARPQRARRRSASSSPARSCCTWRRSSAPSCRPSRRPAPSACPGCSGRWAARPISAAASAISTPTRRPRSNTRSTASPWR